ncbi:AAA family ATPase [Microvirga sp. 0TCS3.31]
MTDDTIRKVVYDTVRHELVQHEQSEHSIPSTAELYRGYPFYRGDLEADAVLWLQSHALPRLKSAKRIGRAVEALQRLSDNVCADFAANASEAALSLLREGGVDPGVDLTLHDVHQRCALYAFQMGFQYVAPDVAACAYRLAARSRETVHIIRYLQRAMTALATPTTSGPQGDRDRGRAMNGALTRLAGWGAYAREVYHAEQAIRQEDKDQVREHLKKQINRLPTLAERIAQAADPLAKLDDFEVEPDEPIVKPKPTGPALVVVPSLDHLPTGRSDRAMPRTEFESLAERALPLLPVPDLIEASAVMRREFPWAEDVIDRILSSLAGRETAVLPGPICLTGRPGNGKTSLARRLGEVLHLPVTLYGCGGSSDGSFQGTSRMYSSGRASVPLQAIRRAEIANPLIVLDELEKASQSRTNGSLLDAVLSVIEPSTRGAVLDPYLEVPVNLQAVNIVACCNSVEALRGPVLDRMTVYSVDDPRPAHLPAVVAGILRDIRLRSGVDPRFVADLDEAEWAVLRRGWKGGSIRPVRRAVERLLALRQVPGVAH